MMASKQHEHGTKTRLLRVLRAVQEQPYRYTKKELAERYGVSKDAIDGDFRAMRNAGFDLHYDEKYRYAFAADKPFEDLKALLQLEEADQLRLLRALEQVDSQGAAVQDLQKRLTAIFGNRQDYPGAADTPGAVSTPGPEHWRRPYRTKFQLLEQARQQKMQVVLLDYRSSNSNECLFGGGLPLKISDLCLPATCQVGRVLTNGFSREFSGCSHPDIYRRGVHIPTFIVGD